MLVFENNNDGSRRPINVPTIIELRAGRRIISGHGSGEIFLFVDFQCPPCMRKLKQLLAQKDQSANSVYLLNLPLSYHLEAKKIAALFEAIGPEDEYVSAIERYASESSLTLTAAKSIIKKSPLTASSEKGETASVVQKIERQTSLGLSLGIRKLPAAITVPGSTIKKPEIDY